ncbi:MAG: hypothetical protein ACHREM_05890 [Polyangiales bacterium]
MLLLPIMTATSSLDALDVVAFARALSIALGRPLNIASAELTAAALLASRLEGDGPLTLLRSIGAARRAVDDARVAARLLDFEVRRTDRTRTITDLREVFDDASILAEAALDRRGKLELEVRSTPAIQVDAPRLSHLVARILRRALEFADAGGGLPSCVVDVTLDDDGEDIAVLEVRAQRLGYGPAHDGAIADVDLLLCRALARLHDGILDVTEEGGELVASLKLATCAPAAFLDRSEISTLPPKPPGRAPVEPWPSSDLESGSKGRIEEGEDDHG